jgi:hypothetical protein
MRVEFLQKFNRGIERVQIRSVKTALRNIIEKAERANTLHEIPNLKKLKGFAMLSESASENIAWAFLLKGPLLLLSGSFI